MKVRWLVVVIAALGVIAANAAGAKRPTCIDRPATFSLEGLFFNPRPQPNGCAQPVYQYGRYIGQDPDRNIRAYMQRDPATGYSGEFSR